MERKGKGRPTKYKKAFCDQLIDHMAKGYSFESFAGLIGVQRATIYNWVEKHPQFLDAKNTAFEKSRLFWERIGVAGTTGKLPGWNPTGWIFNMKNRFNWRDKIETEQNHVISPHDYLMKLIDEREHDE